MVKRWSARGDTYRACEFALLHRPESFGDRVADFDAAFFEFLSSSPKPRVLFYARGELVKTFVKSEETPQWRDRTHSGTLVRSPRLSHRLRVLELVNVALELLHVFLQLSVFP